MRSQQFNIAAMAVFCVSRFICTFLLRFFNPGLLLRTLAVAAALCTLGVMFLQNIWGMYCVVGVSAVCRLCSYDLRYSLERVGRGCQIRGCRPDYGLLAVVLPRYKHPSSTCIALGGCPAVNLSFVLPFVCFVVVTVYGHKAYRKGWA